MTVFNGGKSQAQSQTLLVGGDYPFINMMKTMQSWTYTSGGAAVDPNVLDVNGYLTDISLGGISNLLFGPPSKMGNGTTWVCTWDGRGVVNAGLSTGASTTVTSGSFDNKAGVSPGRCEFTLPASLDGAVSVSINDIASSVDYPHNMQIFLKSEETALNAGQIISTDFKNLLTGKVGVLRFLNWQNANFSAVTNWASRKPVGYYSYYADEFRGSAFGSGAMYAGSTGGTGDAYTATLRTGAPTHGQIIQVKFDHDAVGTSWTLNLNGTGAVPIQEAGAAPYSNISGQAPHTGIICTLAYDADLNIWFKYGGWSGNFAGLRNGPPPEILVQISDKLGCHPYFVVPPLAADPVSDWVTSLDAYIQASGPAWMIPRYETPNENWNPGFFVNAYSLQKASLYWNTSNNGNYHWCGRMASLIGQAIAAGRSTLKVGYQVIVGVWSSTYLSGTQFSNPRVNSPRGKTFKTATFTNASASISVPGNTYSVNDPVCFAVITGGHHLPTTGGVALDEEKTYFVKTTGTSITLSATAGGAALGAFTIVDDTVFSIIPAISPAYNWVTTVACTQYANPNLQNQPGEIAAGYRLLAGDTSQIATYASANDMGVGGALRDSYNAWFSFANGFGLKLCGYEGGWSPDYQQAFTFVYGVISGATKANPCVLTVTQTNYGFPGVSLKSGHDAVVGMPVLVSMVSGMTQLNIATIPKNVSFSIGSPGTVNYGSAHGFAVGQVVAFAPGGTWIKWDGTLDMPAPLVAGIAYFVKDAAPGGDATKFTLSATNGGAAIAITSLPVAASITCGPAYLITAVSGNNITINVDSTSFSTFVANNNDQLIYGATYDPGGGGSGSATYTNAIRVASKTASNLRADTLTNYQQFVAAGGEFPSCFQIAGQQNAWSVWDPDIYASPTPPQWLGIQDFNAVASTITAAFSVMQDTSRYLVRMVGY